nr:uncharacterized protein LOC109175282 [Ipomoea batatas]GME10152.1 uncharacterized protein LOC109175282 [Ipomoea batatas]
MMSQSNGIRIIRHRNARAVCGFQCGSFFYAYGPLYEEMEVEVPGEAKTKAENNLKSSKSATKEAWNYFVDQARRDPVVLKNTILRDDIQIDDGEEVIKGYYMSKIAEVVKEAKSVYDGTNIDEMLESRFKYMMINHGCLFLLQMLVFLGLGVSKLREHSTLRAHQLDTLFGSDNNDIEGMKIGFTKSAVFPGNQIPLVVLNKLIDTTSFFKKIVSDENWEKPSSSSSLDLVLKSVLYDLFLGPVRNSTQPTVDILHGLHSRLVGTTARGGPRENIDPEAIPLIEIRGNNSNLNPQREKMSSATEMHDKGMDFKGVSGMAITEINIKGNAFTNKVLHLPVFTFNEMTKYLYTCLKDYENHQDPTEKVVNDYLGFLSDIVHSGQDVDLLQKKGVIHEVASNEVQKVVKYLSERDPNQDIIAKQV